MPRSGAASIRTAIACLRLPQTGAGGQSEVLLIRGKARGYRVRPAYLLQARRDLGVVQIRIVAALTADELKRADVPAFCPAVHDQDRLAPQDGRAPMTRLTRRRGRNDARSIHF
jgi:hypothetical protein